MTKSRVCLAFWLGSDESEDEFYEVVNDNDDVFLFLYIFFTFKFAFFTMRQVFSRPIQFLFHFAICLIRICSLSMAESSEI